MKKYSWTPQFNTIPSDQVGIRQPPYTNRIAELSYDQVMFELTDNFLKPTQQKQAGANIMGYHVALNSLKLRTFIHSHQHNKVCCADPNCTVKPAYFALEQTKGRKQNHSLKTAYLSLYGLDANGKEVEFTHDHTLARCFGGANVLENTTMMCRPCNHHKSRIESKMHNHTLRILKEYLEETTGSEANPQFLLERVRNAEYNFTSTERQVERLGIVGLEEAMNAIRSPVIHSATWFDKKVKVSGVRLKSFSTQEEPCCQSPDCQIKATHFAVERVSTYAPRSEDVGFYLNMYGMDKEDKEVLFSHYHLLQQGDGGVPDELSVITLCDPCKQNLLQSDNINMASSIHSYGGVTREQWEEDNQSSFGQRKKEKILNVSQRMSAALGFTSQTDFINHCNQEGQRLGYPDIVRNKLISLKRLVKTIPALTPAGARFFYNEQKRLYGKTKHESKEQTVSYEAKHEEVFQPNPSKESVRKNLRYAKALSEYHSISFNEYIQWCEVRAQELNLNQTADPKKITHHQISFSLNCSPGAAQIFEDDCGRILAVGNKRPKNKPENEANSLMSRIEQYHQGRATADRQEKIDNLVKQLYRYAPQPVNGTPPGFQRIK